MYSLRLIDPSNRTSAPCRSQSLSFRRGRTGSMTSSPLSSPFWPPSNPQSLASPKSLAARGGSDSGVSRQLHQEHGSMADFVPTHRLTHEASLKMLAAGVTKANEIGCKVSLAVVDGSCRLIAFLMMDGARHFSIITTQRHAITAASQRQPTGYAPEENALSMAVRMRDFTNVPGGFPITAAGEVIGAVAAGGATIEQDVMIAQAALAALDAA